MAEFHVPPQCGGQTVEYSYAAVGEPGVIECCYDRSDRTTTYRLYPWLADAPPDWEPWNGDTIGAPFTSLRSRQITPEEVQRLSDGEG